MTTTTLIALPATPEEFLATDPRTIRDTCGPTVQYPHPELLLPNTVALLRRLGGPDAVPAMGRGRERVNWEYGDGDEDRAGWPSATLRERFMGDVVARLTRWDREIAVQDWHPEDAGLTIVLIPPADWSAAPWAIRSVYGGGYESYVSHAAAFDILAARALDRWIGEKGDPKGTFFQVLSETIRP
jgi:hypothetical protein